MIAGTVCVYDFPLDLFTLCDLAKRCDLMILRLDVGCHHRREFLDAIIRERFPAVELRWQFAATKWKYSNHWHGREAMLRELDSVAPSIVLQPDADEVFGPGVERDLERLTDGGDGDLMMFRNEMAAIDGAELPHHPPAPHCRAYRWRPGLTFCEGVRYRGFCRPTLPGIELREVAAESRVIHFARFLPEWRAINPSL